MALQCSGHHSVPSILHTHPERLPRASCGHGRLSPAACALSAASSGDSAATARACLPPVLRLASLPHFPP